MSNQETQSIVKMAKLAVSRPAVAVTLLRLEEEAVRENILTKLRIYPAAIMGLLRADNMPRAWKPLLESELEAAGFKMMT